MSTESRQVRRARERLAKKSGGAPATHQVYYIPFKRKSRAGVEYTYYKKIIDKKGLNNVTGSKNIEHKGDNPN